MTIKILSNNEEVAEVFFEYVTRDRDVEIPHDKIEAYESEHGCHFQFHSDLRRKTSSEIIRLIHLRTAIWRGVKTLAFYVDSDIFKYEGIGTNCKKIVMVIIPFAQVNSIQTCSRKVSKLKTKLDATTIQELK
jgi:hypothetical protein